jgi:hypothetical protein
MKITPIKKGWPCDEDDLQKEAERAYGFNGHRSPLWMLISFSDGGIQSPPRLRLETIYVVDPGDQASTLGSGQGLYKVEVAG